MQGRWPILPQSSRLPRSSASLAEGPYRQLSEVAGSARSWSSDVSQPSTAHLVGIGGSGMRALAKILLDRGWNISGSDLSDATSLASSDWSFHDKQVRIHRGHSADHLSDKAECVIYSEAVWANNPELLAAINRRLPILTCYEMVGRLMANQHGIAVAGTHGKSTVTAMAAHVLIETDKDPSVFCGAALTNHATGGRAGSGPFLSEACEYQSHFLRLPVKLGVVLGIEPDHFDCFDSMQNLEAAFGQFVKQIASDGRLLVWSDCKTTRRVAQAARCEVETLAVKRSSAPTAYSTAVWTVEIIESKQGKYWCEVTYCGEPIAQIRPPVPGEHNLLNMLAAFAIAYHQGCSPEQIVESLESFPGLERRLETIGTWGGVTLIDDYAHHPTEVRAAISAVRQMHPGRRLVTVFQPHQTSRTEALLDEFVLSLQNVNQLWVADIFRAREDLSQRPTVTAADVADRVRCHGIEVSQVHRLKEISIELTNRLECDDILLTLGAGNVRKVCDEFVSQYKKLHQRK